MIPGLCQEVRGNTRCGLKSLANSIGDLARGPDGTGPTGRDHDVAVGIYRRDFGDARLPCHGEEIDCIRTLVHPGSRSKRGSWRNPLWVDEFRLGQLCQSWEIRNEIGLNIGGGLGPARRCAECADADCRDHEKFLKPRWKSHQPSSHRDCDAVCRKRDAAPGPHDPTDRGLFRADDQLAVMGTIR